MNETNNLIAKKLFDTESRIAAILEERTAETIDREAKLSKAETDKAAATRRMEEATRTGDEKAYRKAKEERNIAADAAEMYQARIDALNNKPLVSEEEYSETAAAIIAECEKYCEERKAQVLQLFDKMKQITIETRDTIRHTNKVLHEWQHTINRGADIRHYANGGPMVQDEKRINNRELEIFIDSILSEQSYRQLVGLPTFGASVNLE